MQIGSCHCCGLGGSRAVLTTSRWADTGFIHCNRWFCCRGLGRQLLLGVGVVGALVGRPGCSLLMSSLFLPWHTERS